MYKILLIDDDPDIRASLGVLLKRKSYDVHTAVNKTDALQIMSSNKPDLILLDINMTTDQEGLDMAMEMRNHPEYKKIPVVIITGIEVMTGNNTIVELAREMRANPAFENLNVLLIKDVDGTLALDFKSTLKGKSVNLPVSGFLHKPISPEGLWKEVERVMNNI